MPVNGPDWVFPARCVHVVDGDTLDVVCDVGFRITRQVRLRLAEVDTAEVYGVNASEAGQEQAQFVREWIPQGNGPDWPLVVETTPDTGKYGRYLARVQRVSDGEYLADALKSEYPTLDDG